MKKAKWYLKIVLLYLLFQLNLQESKAQWNPAFSIGTTSGNYVVPYNQPAIQLQVLYAATYNSSAIITYQWYSSSSFGANFSLISGATSATYTPPGAVTQTAYYRLQATNQNGASFYSNTIKIQVGSVNWENQNYIREHEVITPGVTTWQAVDQLPVTQNVQLNADGLPVAQKMQSTTYIDGLGRPVEKVAREAATPAAGNTLWGDIVQFSQFDIYGRQPKKFLPYTIQYTSTSGTESGEYKSSPSTAQASYYSTVYNETSPYSQITYEANPLDRPQIVNAPGASWAISAGNSALYDVNDATDNVQILTIGYTSGALPVSLGVYPAYTLVENTATDENGKKVVTYTNSFGQVILTKTQIDDNPTAGTAGWICVYSVYDDFGLLRYRLQPEAVKYFEANSWDFTTTTAQTLLNEMCFRYEYDSKGRNILKKAPGAAVLNMLYDIRNRAVYLQDGNQAAKSPAEWTLNLYDELDRVTLTALYHTTKTIPQLQTDINNATTNSTATITSSNPVNLSVASRDVTINLYAAQNSVTFNTGFTSNTNDNFVAQIDATSTTNTISTLYRPIASATLNDPTVTTVLKYFFYDSYSFTGAKTFDNTFDNTTAYSTSDPNVIPVATSARTLSFPTGSKTRVLGTNTFLASTVFYDNKGRAIQTLEDNIKQGVDVTTMQYHFDGRLLSVHNKHTTNNSGYNAFSTLTKNLFDIAGRVTSIQKKYGSNPFETVSSYDFDDMGRIKTKHLDPGYTGSGKTEMEGLDYSYNIHGQITGINKNYARKASGYSKWDHFFGFYLGYDNKDLVFSAAQLDGHVTGTLWSTQGDDVQRRFDYTYDNAGRLASALFVERQNTTDGWTRTKLDFSTTGTTGGTSKIAYDLNGNLLSMLQRGVIPGNTAPVDIDKLTYTYSPNSNKLLKVQDATTQTANNGKSGDFSDGTNGTNNDYVYDANGNVVTDLNKNIKDLGGVSGNGITYNFLDKPEQVRISGKGVVDIVYDADGNKLQKIFIPETGGPTVTTTYINQFVYIGDDVKYINFEEGRLRVIQPVSQGNGYDALVISGSGITLPGSKEGVYDYFVRDYQENVRMILTEETHNGSNKCTMENSRASAEDPIFQGSGSEVENTRVAINTIPGQTGGGGWQSNTTSSVSKLGNYTGGLKTGPNVLLKVMAGDLVNATTKYYYASAVTNTSGSQALTQNVLTSIINAISGSGSASTLVKGNTTGIQTALNGSTPFANITEPDATNATGNAPKAYLTVIFFDERFNYVATGSTFARTSQAGDGATPLTLANIQAPKNGYAFVYISNEDPQPVYFDDLNVGLNRGRIIEEDHYYAFGLKIAAISSVKAPDANEGNINNKNLYNDKELIDEGDLNWYDYGFRSYDAQIGRFPQLDPLTDDYPELTPYQYASNDPIGNVDLDGLEGVSSISVVGDKAVSGFYNVVVDGSHHVSWWSSVKSSVGKVASQIGDATVRAAKDVASFGLGVANAWSSNQALGLGRSSAGANGLYEDRGMFYGIGQKFGDFFSMITGGGEVIGGGGTLVLSGGITVPVSAPIAVHGATSFGMGLYHLFSDKIEYNTEKKEDNSSGDNASNSSPPKEKMERFDGKKPKYVKGEHYKDGFNKGGDKNKTPLPDDAESVYQTAVPDRVGENPRTWYGVNKDGIVYRYSADKNGAAHFSGRSDYGDGIRNYTDYAKDRLTLLNPKVRFNKK